jgi:hypothetical protein
MVPGTRDADQALERVAAAGAPVQREPGGGVARDPWGTAVRIRAA